MLEFVWKTDDCCCKSWERDLQSGRDHEGSLKMIRQDMMSSLQFSHSVVSKSLWPHGLQHTRPPCSSPIPGVYSNSCPLSRWCHPTISLSVVPFSSLLQSFPASGSFPMSQFFSSGIQSIGVSALVSDWMWPPTFCRVFCFIQSPLTLLLITSK